METLGKCLDRFSPLELVLMGIIVVMWIYMWAMAFKCRKGGKKDEHK